MMQDNSLRSNGAYTCEHLLHCILLSGMLKSSHAVRPALEVAIRAAVPHKTLQDHLISLLRTGCKTPGKSVQYHHRFMFAMGFNALLATRAEELFRGDEVVRFSSFDSSAQHGWDWVMAGHLTLKGSEGVSLFRLVPIFVELSRRQSKQPLDDKDQESLTAARAAWSRSLVLRAGVLVAVGSGRADLRYKVHALVHSVRLVSNSWAFAVRMTNATFSVAGDMGTASLTPSVCYPLQQTFGDWLVDTGRNRRRRCRRCEPRFPRVQCGVRGSACVADRCCTGGLRDSG